MIAALVAALIATATSTWSTWLVLAWMLGAYLLAGVPVGLLIGLARGVDLRDVGSGNIGATNAIRALGKRWGLLVFVLDVAKAGVPVALAQHQFADAPDGTLAIAWISLAAIIGHVFPIYLRFRGGKGVACAFGVFLVLAPHCALLGLLVYLLALWLTRVSAIGSLLAASVIVASAWIDPRVPFPYVILAATLAGLIWERHRPNLAAIFDAAAKAREAQRKL